MRFGPEKFISEQQKQFYYCNSPYPSYVTGYGGGKTYIGAWKALRMSQWHKGMPGLVVEPTYRDISQVLLPVLYDDILKTQTPYGDMVKVVNRQGDWRMYLPWGSEIIFRSGQNPETIKGVTAAWAYIDEGGQMPERAFQNVTARTRHPNRKIRPQHIFTTFTPELGGWTHEKWGRMELFGEDLPVGYEVFQGTTFDNWITGDDFAQAQLEMWGPEEAQSRVYGKFAVTRSGRVYYTFSEENIDRSLEYDPNQALWFTFDFNKTPGNHALVFQKQRWKYCFIDEARNLGANYGSVDGLTLEDVCRFLGETYGRQHTGKVFITGDPSGQHSASRTNYFSTIRDHLGPYFSGQLVFKVPSAAPEVIERISNVNRLLRNSKGYCYIFIHPKCKRLLADLQILMTESGKADQMGKPYKGTKPNEPDRGDQRLTHASDAIGYLLWIYDPLKTRFDRALDYRKGNSA